MEIDLNNEVTEVEKNASFCDREFEKGVADGVISCCWSSSTCSSSSSSSALVSSSYLELWHACAGPLTSLPKKENVVVYFPQGHLEQVASFSPFTLMEIPTYDLKPQIFCRVVNVQLLVSTEFSSWIHLCLLNFMCHVTIYLPLALALLFTWLFAKLLLLGTGQQGE